MEVAVAKVTVGLEVGSSAVRMAAVARGRSGASLQQFGQVGLAPGTVVDGEVVDSAALTEAIRQLLKSTKPASKDVHLGAVSQRMVARQVDLPWVPQKEFKKALPLLAADLLPMPVEDCVLDFLPYEEVLDDDGSRLLRGLLVAAGEDGVLAMVEAIEATGLRVVSVTLTPLATLGAVADVHASGAEAVIDVGASMTSVTIQEHGQPHFVRILSRGGRDITTALAETLAIGEDEAERWKVALPSMWATMSPADRSATENAVRSALTDLVTDIRTSIDFYKTSENRRIERAYVVGGGGATIGLIPILANVLRVPVLAGTPHGVRAGKGLTVDRSAQAATPAAVPAVSLALGAA
jgi:type IV pilus assembly protein PilM